MPTFLILLVLLFLMFLLTALGLSFRLTRRQSISEIHTPTEYGLEFEEVYFPASDGLRLRGWWIPAVGSERVVIIMHGHGGSVDWDVRRSPPLIQAGFNVFLFDFRAHGRSQGKSTTFGYLERRDLLGAVAFLKSRGMRKIGVIGFSLGGTVAMLTAPVCPDILAVISDDGPARIRTALRVYGLEQGYPRWFAVAFAWLAMVGASLRLGANLFCYESVRWVGKIAPRPIFFIHGEQDQYLPDFDELYAAANQPKEAWRVAEAGHTTVGQFFPEEHERRIVEFFARHLA
jgi:fermentation-respiration switch protein FrsA (DUF1100 family)